MIVYPCTTGVEEIELESETSTLILKDTQKIILSKEADKHDVQKDTVVEYTITIKNEGRLAETQNFTDYLPEEITLTEESKQELIAAGFTVTENTIEKQITIEPGQETKISYKAIVNTDEKTNIENTAIFGELSSSDNLKASNETYEIKKELTSRIVEYYTAGYSGDSEGEQKPGYKITSGDRLNYIGPGDLIEYTIAVTIPLNTDRTITSQDADPSISYGTVLGFYIYDNRKSSTYAMLGDEEFPYDDYKNITNNKMDFKNSDYTSKNNSIPYVFTVRVPANTTYEQTFLLKVGATVEKGSIYDESYDLFMDKLRSNAGYASRSDLAPQYPVPYNYIYDQSDRSKNAIVYQKVEPRYYISKGVLARTRSGEEITYGDMWGDWNRGGKNLKEFSNSTEEVITFYTYLVNDSLDDLDLSKTIITDYMPEGYRFIGFNNIQGTKSVSPSGSVSIGSDSIKLSNPTLSATNFSENSYLYRILWVNDEKTTAPYEISNCYFQLNNPNKENSNITWEASIDEGAVSFSSTRNIKARTRLLYNIFISKYRGKH